MKKFAITILLLASLCNTYSQQLYNIANTPSNEIYDMLIDSKGFLWIAHSLGISRFDGVNFTNFSSTYQSAVGTSGLLEDKYGRIWFHNFNGQVFYIEHEKMEYLKQYNYNNSFNFPHMAIYGDELAITSSTGLFLCNIKTLKCRTETVKNDTIKWGTTSICVLNGKVLGHSSYYDKSIWLTYSPAEGLKEIHGEDNFFFKSPTVNATLYNQSFFDTAVIIDRGSNAVYGITLKNNKLSVAFKKETKAYINTINIVNNNLWINTRTGSFKLYGKDTLNYSNTTCILPDTQGNIWYGSLTNGLLFENKNTAWQRLQIPAIPNNDLVQCMLNDDDDNFIACTRSGYIISKKNGEKKYTNITSMPVALGAPENIQKAGQNKFFITSTRVLFMLDDVQKKTSIIDSNNIKCIAIAGKSMLLGTSFGLKIKKNILPITNTNDSFFVATGLKQTPFNYTQYKAQRCRAVLFDSTTKQTYVSFPSGLLRIKNGIETPVLFNQSPLYVSAMVMLNGKIYASTFNDGLFMIEHDSAIKVKHDIESPLDAIIKLKNCRHHLWLFRTHDIEMIDKLTGRFINIYSLPTSVPDILDVEEDSANIYLATAKGLFVLPFNANIRQDKKPIMLTYALINNKDTLFDSNYTLKNYENNLLLRLAIPIYDDAEKIHFKYSLTNSSDDTIWYYTHDAQRDIQFNALKPGSYTFTAIAMKDNEVISTQPLIYQFTISPPWYNTITFYITAALAIVALTIGIQQYRLRQILKIERVRRKISNDLHDDIGSTLSSINIYSQLAKTEDDNKEYIDTIQQNTVSIIGNLDDLVWNINPKNDVLENLLARMRLFAEPLLFEKSIEYTFTTDIQDMHIAISPDIRTNVYLLFKEAVNNVVKHSQSSKCTINLTQKGKLLVLDITDNGRGFDSQVVNRHRNGLHSMQQRVNDIKGTININSQPGQGTHITVTCQVK